MNLDTIDLDSIYNDLKTGDIVLFRSKRWTRFFTKYTHVGMIVDINSQKFILEINRYDYKKYNVKKGVGLYEIYSRIESFSGDVYILPMKYKYITIEKQKKLFLNLSKYKEIEFDNTIYSYLFKKKLIKLGFPFIKFKQRNGMFCSEFIEYILKDTILNDTTNGSILNDTTNGSILNDTTCNVGTILNDTNVGTILNDTNDGTILNDTILNDTNVGTILNNTTCTDGSILNDTNCTTNDIILPEDFPILKDNNGELIFEKMIKLN